MQRHVPNQTFSGNRARTLAGEPVMLPERTRIDGALVRGAAIFGLGWGLSGICPPARVAPAVLAQTEAMARQIHWGITGQKPPG